MKRFKKYILVILVLLVVTLNVRIFDKNNKSYTIIETIMNKYSAYLIRSGGTVYTSLLEAYTLLGRGAIVDFVGDGDISTSTEIPLTATLNIVGDTQSDDPTIPESSTLTVKSGNTLNVKGTLVIEDNAKVIVEAGAKLYIYGNLQIAEDGILDMYGHLEVDYNSSSDIEGTINFLGETSKITTNHISSEKTQATMEFGQKSALVVTNRTALNNLTNFNIINHGLLFEDAELLAILSNTSKNNTIDFKTITDGDRYYSKFSIIPEETNVTVTGLYYTNADDTIAEGVTVTLNKGSIIMDADLVINGELSTKGGLLEVDNLGGTGTLIIVPGESANEHTTKINGVLQGTDIDLEIYENYSQIGYYGLNLIKFGGYATTQSEMNKYENMINSFNINYAPLVNRTEIVPVMGKYESGTFTISEKHYCSEPDCPGHYSSAEAYYPGYYITFRPAYMQDIDFYHCIVKTLVGNSELPKIMLETGQLQAIRTLNCPGKFDEEQDNPMVNIKNTEGIQYLENLQTLDLSGNSINTINLIRATDLTSLNLNDNRLSSLDLNSQSNLVTLKAKNNFINTIDFGVIYKIKTMEISNNSINSLYMGNLVDLETLDASNNSLNGTIIFPESNTLTNIKLENTNISSLVFTTPHQLSELVLTSNYLQTIDISPLQYLKKVSIQTKQKYKLTLGVMPLLEEFSVEGQSIEKNEIISDDFDLRPSQNLKTFVLNNANLDEFKTNSGALTYVSLQNNNLTSANIEFKNCTNLTTLLLNGNDIEELDLSNCPLNNGSIRLNNNPLESIKLKDNSGLRTLDLSETLINELDVTKQTDLEELKLTYISPLNGLDLSQNTKLNKLDLSGTTFKSTVYLTHEDINPNYIIPFNDSGIYLPDTLKSKINIVDSGADTITLGKGTLFTSVYYTLDTPANEFCVDYAYYIPNITSSKYEVSDEDKAIYISDDDLANVESNVTVDAAKKLFDQNQLYIYHNNTENLEETPPLYIYKIIGTKTTLSDEENKIDISGKLIFKDLLETFVNIGNPDIKLFDSSNEEITNENTYIKPNMTLKIMYNGNTYETFSFIGEYIDLTDVEIDEEKGYVKGLNPNTTVSSLENVMNSTGTYTYYDRSGQEITLNPTDNVYTGLRVKIELSDDTFEYTLVIKGDVRGTGTSTISDVMRIIDHVLTDSKLTESYDLEAANINEDDNISISDVMLLIDNLM